MHKIRNLKQIFIDSSRELLSVRTLTLCGIFGALAVILNFTTSIELNQYMKISFSDLANHAIEILFGPVVGCIFGGAMDLVNFIVRPTGPFFFGYTFSAMLSGLIYGMVLYHKPLTIPRVLVADLLIKVFINCLLGTLWLSMLYGKGFYAILPMRILKNAIMLPIDTAIEFTVLTAVSKVAARFDYGARPSAV